MASGQSTTEVAILLVDDDPRNLVALEAMLSDLELTLVGARSAREALRELLRRDFALILLDVQMPEIDGIETASLIRSRERNKHIPIIFLTAYSQTEEHVARGYSVGAVDFLFKPPVPEVLRSKVSVFVDLHRKTQELEAHAELLRMAERRDHERRLAEFRASLEAATLRAEMEAERRANERLQLLADVATELLSSGDPRPLLIEMSHRFVRHLGFELCVTYLCTDVAHQLALVGSAGVEGRAPVASRVTVEPGRWTEEVFDRRRRVVSSEPHDPPPPKWLRELQLATYAVFPLTVQEKVLGLIACGRTGHEPLGLDDIATMQVVCDQTAMALERDQLVHRLREHAEELADAHQRKDEFLAMLAHELRNPLAPMSYALELVRDRLVTVPGLGSFHEVMERQLGHLSRMVDDLLDVSRITSGKIELKRGPVSANAIVEQAIQTSMPLLEKHDHRWFVEPLAEDVELFADATRLTQVIANLVNNAARYTDRGGEIRVMAERDDDELVLRVRDNGRGIPQDMLPRVFDLFVQADQSRDRAQGGLGLGLTLVRRLVEMHGGTVTATSPGPGEGTEFVVRLPVLAIPVRELHEERPVVDPQNHPLRILVVEDNDDSRDMLQMLLEGQGHSVDVAGDGLTGLERLLASVHDVALVDVGLPGIDGYDLARRLRERRPGSSPRLVALTGYGQAEDRARALAAGFDEHLVKPVTVVDLQRVLMRGVHSDANASAARS
ncbi:MAG TPA: response regulator [Nannocystaceae bacterium]|nr:response regulator [Nannocystaceae bacterium]